MGKTYAGSFINSRFIKNDDVFVLTRSAVHEKDAFGFRQLIFLLPTILKLPKRILLF